MIPPPKALAFRLIDDIKDFVYSYVLDEKGVNIDILRENVRTYQELEKTLDSVKRRIAKLEMIEGYHAQVQAARPNLSQASECRLLSFWGHRCGRLSHL